MKYAMKETSFIKVDEDEIIKFENQIGYDFSKDYRDFIISCNGGIPINRCFKISEDEGDSLIHGFYGFNQSTFGNIIDNFFIFREDIRMGNYLAIADDQGGNQIAFEISDLNNNKGIYFINMDGMSSPLCISDFFLSFFNGLYTPVSKDFLENLLKYGTILDLENAIEGKKVLVLKDELGRTILENSVIYMRLDYIEYLIPFFEQNDISVALLRAMRNAELFDGYDGIIEKLKNALNT